MAKPLGSEFSSLVELLAARAREKPETTAYTFLTEGETPGASLTYRELERRAQAVAAALQEAGAGGGRALLLYPPGLDFVVAFFGCLLAGTVAVPGYPPRSRRGLPRLKAVALDARPRCALTDADSLARFQAMAGKEPEVGALPWLTTDDLDPALADRWRAPALGPDSLAFLQYTSGSTSAPKGVMVSHGGLLHNEGLIQQVFGQSESSLIVGWLPLYHDMGLIGNVLQPLFLGTSCVLMSPLDFLQKPLRWLQAISRYRATTSGGPNFAYELCVHKIAPEDREGLDLSSWQVAFNGAEPIRAASLEQFAAAYEPYGFRRQAFLPCYGLAEATLLVTGKPWQAAPRIGRFDAAQLEQGTASPQPQGRELVGCGASPSEQTVLIVDPERATPCPPGQVGEVWVSGPSVAKGYWNRPEQTEEEFRARLAGSDVPFLRTGDLGFLDGGDLFVTGRLKDLIIIRGRNHYPQDIELTAERSHPSLRLGCTAAFSVDEAGEEVLVVVQEVRREKLQEDPEEMAAALRRAVTENHDVEVWDVVLVKPGGVPKTSSGKIQRRGCRQAYLAGELPVLRPKQGRASTETAAAALQPPVAPEIPLLRRADLEALSPAVGKELLSAGLRQEAARALRLSAAAVDADLPLILDSLAAMELKSRLEEALEIALPLALFFETPTLGELEGAVWEALGPERGQERGQELVTVAGGAALGEEFPLAYGQSAFWFLERLAPGSGAYHVSFAARLAAGADPQLWLRAFEVLVARHEALRTVFVSGPGGPRQGGPRQKVLPAAPVPLVEIDAAGWDPSRLERRMVEEVHRPFSLREGPLLRLAFFHQPQGTVLLLVLHHLVTDLWSLVLLAEELEQLLPALAASGSAAPTALAQQALAAPTLPPAAPYRDFVAWQRELLAGPVGERQWQYWRQQLEGASLHLELPTDRPRRQAGAGRGGTVAVPLDESLEASLGALAGKTGCTLFGVLLGTFQLLLQRYSGQRDLLVGAPAAGRGQAGLAPIVGYLVNTLVFRGRLADDPRGLDFLRRTGAAVRGALEHQDFPYPLLVERLQPQRAAGHSPLVQAFFTLEKPHRPELASLAAFVLGQSGASFSLGGQELSSVALPHGAVQFDLEMVVAQGEQGLGAVLHTNADLLDGTTARRLAGHYQELLRALTARPEARLSHLSLLSRGERQQVLHEWNSWPSRGEATSFVELFERRVADGPSAVALIFEGEEGQIEATLTYEELDRRAQALAAQLGRLGVAAETVVAVLLPRSPEVCVALLGVQKAGGCYLPLDPAYPADRLAHMLEDSGASVVVTLKALAAAFGLGAGTAPGRPKAFLLDSPSAVLAGLPAVLAGLPAVLAGLPAVLAGLPAALASEGETRSASLSGSHAAYSIYTSGSTGLPKGAVLTHAGLTNLARAQSRAFGVGAGSRVLQFAALSFDASISEMAMAWAGGGALCLSRSPDMLPGPGLARLLERLAITHVTLPPSSLAALPLEPLPHLQTLICAGEELPGGLVQRWAQGRRVFNAYGPTEATVCSTLVPCRPGQAKPTIGSPLDNVRCYVVCRDGQLAPTEVPGELYVGGISLARGYHGRPALTAQRFVPDVSGAGPGARLYRTGDLVRWKKDGHIEFLGRLDEQVKVRGFRVEPGEIEATLLRHPQVRKAVVVLRSEGAAAGHLAAYVVPAADEAAAAPPELTGLKDFLRATLPEYMVPSWVVTMEELPTTPSGKIDRRALPDPAAQAREGAIALPRRPLERAVAEVWRQVLGVEKVGIDESFFDLGGHSLLVAQVHELLQERLRDQVPVEISMVDLFRYPTIRALVDYLGQQGAGGLGGAAQSAGRERAKARRERVANDDRAIAVVGLACRFPGAPDAAAFWQNLRQGVESVTEFSDEELAAAGAPRAQLEDPAYVKAGVVLDDIDRFDAGYFGYTPKEAESMDPQHRLFLEVALEALEDAGCDPGQFPGAIGIFAGAGLEAYMMRQVAAGLPPAAAYQLSIGNLKDFLASRVAYKLNLLGPALAVQTACSTSLVAVHLACQSLLTGECDAVLAGGVSIEIPQRAGYLYQPGMIFAPDGHCRPFDAAAGGTLRGSGAGVVVLKRLADALRDGDAVRAVIRGSAVNNDGALKIGYTAPSVERQAAVIAEALTVAAVDPASITYVEAHGTGTELGDPIEIEALTAAFRGTSSSDVGATATCAVGSVKSNFGHLDSAAGVAGLIKTVLALEHGEIPPSLHFRQPNPKLKLEQGPFFIAGELRPWPTTGEPRRAGVSSFGIGGTNAHVVLEEAPPPIASGAGRPWQLITLSARSRQALDEASTRLAARLAGHLEGEPDWTLADVAYTLQTGRRSHDYRRLALCRKTAEAAAVLETLDPQRLWDSGPVQSQRPVAFLFPGQGAQHPDMGRRLYEGEAVFRHTVDHCGEVLKEHLGEDLRTVLYPSPERWDEAARRLQETRLAQPALFVVSLALARQWQAWGVEPEGMLGHSIGEWVAATLAEVFTVEDALALVAARGWLMQGMPAGSMLSVGLGSDALIPRLPAGLDLAAVNGPDSCVVSGPSEAVAALAATLEGEGISVQTLKTSHAFHSAMMEPASQAFQKIVEEIPLGEPQRPFISNLSGTWIRPEEATDPAYWARHLRQPVRFADGIATLAEDASMVLLEVGPGDALSNLARRHPRRQPEQGVFASLPHPKEHGRDLETVLTTFGRLWLSGVEVSWKAFYDGQRRAKVSLPTYPFQRQRYWVEPAAARELSLATQPSGPRPLEDWFYQPYWQPAPPRRGTVAAGERWLLLTEGGGAGEGLAEALRSAGAEVVLAEPGATFTHRGPGRYRLPVADRDGFRALLADLEARGGLPRRIVHLWCLGTEGAESLAGQRELLERGFFSLVALAQALGGGAFPGLARKPEPGADGLTLTVVASGLAQVFPQEEPVPELAALVGACRVLGQEYPGWTSRCVDVGRAAAKASAETAWRTLMEDLAAPEGETLSAWRQGRRWLPDFAAVPLAAVAAESKAAPRLRDGATVLITGGLGDLGFAAAEHLAKGAAAQGRALKLALLSRTALAPEAEPPSERLRRVRALEAAGAQVLVLAADVADPVAVAGAVAQVRQRFGPVHGVLHAAGVAGGGVLQGRSRQEMVAVLSPKLAGARALAAALADASPDFFLVYSSLAATLGGFGQADYSAANGALEAFAESYALRHPETFCAAIAWGAWTEIGMAAQGDGQDGAGQGGDGQDGVGQERGTGEAAAQLWRRLTGDREAGIATAQGLEALDRILGQRIGPRVLVSPRALPELIAAYRRAIDPEELLRELEVPVPAGERHPRPPLQTRFVKAGTDLERQLVEIWQEQLGLAEVGILDNFFELGGTSLLGIQVVSQIRRRLEVDVPAVSLYEGSTVKALAELVGKLLGDEPAAAEEEQAASRSRGARRRELARLRQQTVGGGR